MRDSATGPVTWATLVLAAAVVASTGVFGGVTIWSGRSFRSIETLLSPNTLASCMWVVVLCGMGAHCVWLWTSRGRASQRAASVTWWLFATILLDAAWLLCSLVGWVWPSVVAMGALVAALVVVNRVLDRAQPRDRVEQFLLDGTFGLHLGWGTLAFMAALTQALVHSGMREVGLVHTIWAVALLGILVLLARLVIPRVRLFQAVLFGALWGLVWLGVTRLTGDLRSVPVALAAFVSAAAIVIMWIVRDRDVPSGALINTHPRS